MCLLGKLQLTICCITSAADNKSFAKLDKTPFFLFFFNKLYKTRTQTINTRPLRPPLTTMLSSLIAQIYTSKPQDLTREKKCIECHASLLNSGWDVSVWVKTLHCLFMYKTLCFNAACRNWSWIFNPVYPKTTNSYMSEGETWRAPGTVSAHHKLTEKCCLECQVSLQTRGIFCLHRSRLEQVLAERQERMRKMNVFSFEKLWCSVQN